MKNWPNTELDETRNGVCDQCGKRRPVRPLPGPPNKLGRTDDAATCRPCWEAS